MTVRYRAFGLMVQSEIAIPGALFFSGVERDFADVAIRVASVPNASGGVSHGPYCCEPEGLVFEQPSVGRFLAAWSGEEMRVEAYTGANEEQIASALVATALPMLLWIRGALLLHAAVAMFPDSGTAIAIVGSSGAGKSTLLERLVRAGAQVVAEDSVCLREQDDRIAVSGLPSRIYMRLPGEDLHAIRRSEDLPEDSCEASAFLSRILVLDPLAPRRPNWESLPQRLPTVPSLSTLLRHRYRPRVPEILGQSGSLLPRWINIASAIPIYSSGRPILEATGFHDLLRWCAEHEPQDERPCGSPMN